MVPHQPESAEPTLDPRGRLPDTQKECPAGHGSFLAKHYAGCFWSKCPECEREKIARHEAALAAEAAANAERARVWNHADSGLVGRFKRATFDTFIARTPEQRVALEASRAFASTCTPAGGGGLWLIGQPGAGKTHLGSAMVLHLIDQRGLGACVHGVHEIMQMIKASFGTKGTSRSAWEGEPETGEQILERLGSVPLLVLDEIGVARGSDWEAEQLFTIVDMRYRLERPTVLISNLPAPEIKATLGPRVYDRLREGVTVIPMNWASHRGETK